LGITACNVYWARLLVVAGAQVEMLAIPLVAILLRMPVGAIPRRRTHLVRLPLVLQGMGRLARPVQILEGMGIIVEALLVVEALAEVVRLARVLLDRSVSLIPS
jgi:hypothetical protein